MTSDSSITGHIVAMGGGGFSMEPDNPLLDDFILSLSQRQPAQICFVPTASADSAAYVAKFYRAFSGRAIATDLTLFDPSSLPRNPPNSADLVEFVAKQDIIYVGGGNTANLLAMWRVHGLDKLFREAWERGAVLCGVSAGMICWFSGGVTDSFGKLEGLHDGLGLIKTSACPHYDGETERQPTYRQLVGDGFPAGYAADDSAALHFHGTELVEAVTSKRNANAYRVERKGNEVVELRLPVRYLGEEA